MPGGATVLGPPPIAGPGWLGGGMLDDPQAINPSELAATRIPRRTHEERREDDNRAFM
jgi:hypothetical protein